MARWKRVAAIAAVALLVVAASGATYLHLLVTGIAKDNLSSHDFVRTHDWLPWEHGLATMNVTIPSGDLALAGWWMPADGAINPADDGGTDPSTSSDLTVVLVHGLGSNMSKPTRMWAPQLHAAGYDLLAFDLRNHGASPDGVDGYVTYGVDEADDVAAAVTYLRTHANALGVDPQRIVLYGASMGAASVLNAAAKQPAGVVGVIADSPFASFSFEAHVDGEAQGYPRWIVDRVLSRMDHLAPSPPTDSKPRAALGDILVPILIAHCSDDENLTFPNFEAMVAAKPGMDTWSEPCPKVLSDEHHIDGWGVPSYNATVAAFLSAL